MTPPLPAPASVPAVVEVFARVSVGDAEFAASVESAPEPTGHVLRIVCRSGCAKPVVFEEPEGDSPISLFRRWDGGPLLYSLWSSGSAYRVKVFALTPGGVRTVLDAYTLDRPDFTSRAGVEFVRTTERRTERSPPGDTRTAVYSWTGEAFTRR